MEIHVYKTHIEIFPYEKGSHFEIEKLFYKWNYIYHKYESIGLIIQKNKLFLPRIADISMLEKEFETMAIIETDCDPFSNISKYNMTSEPRNQLQIDTIDFLTGYNKFKYTGKYSQIGLNIDTGEGKTYCMINAIVKYRMKTIIILHKTSIKTQWVDTIVGMTDIPKDNVLDISSLEMMEKLMNWDSNPPYDIYTINHQLITSFGTRFGWDNLRKLFSKLSIGIKVFDESHKFFVDSLKIDFFTNTLKTFYLTATFARSDYNENRIYKLAYSNLVRFGENECAYEGKRRHVVMIPVMYNSYPDGFTISKMNNKTGSFSGYNFIDYALSENNQTLVKVLLEILHRIENIEGKILITVPKIDATEYIADILRKELLGNLIMTVNSKNNIEDNIKARKNAKVIVSTIKSIGQGDDIKKLRCIINFEPIGSWTLAHQLRGRLREYGPTDDTYLFYPIDTGIPKLMVLYNRILIDMKKFCKEIVVTDMYNI